VRFEALEHAREILDLHDRVSLAEIKEQYRTLMKRWHPDTCPEEDKALCEEKSRELTRAYDLLMEYVGNYKYSFTEAEVAMQLSGAEWWMNKFGQPEYKS
jgi:DnaJ-class molecular chaperone